MPPGSTCLPQEVETSQLTAQPKAFLAKDETGPWQPSDTQETLHTFTPDLTVFRLIPAPLSAPRDHFQGPNHPGDSFLKTLKAILKPRL